MQGERKIGEQWHNKEDKGGMVARSSASKQPSSREEFWCILEYLIVSLFNTSLGQGSELYCEDFMCIPMKNIHILDPYIDTVKNMDLLDL